MSLRVLVAEDEELMSRMLEVNLAAEGFEVAGERDGAEAHRRAGEGAFDLLLLDVTLPTMNGFQIARALRAEGASLPILMLTSRADVASRVRGLDAGADDFLAKPFELAELLARVRALVRRARGKVAAERSPVVRLGRCEVNLETREATTQLGHVQLTEPEAKVMELFVRHRGETLTRADIADEVWHAEAAGAAVDGVVGRLVRYFDLDPAAPTHILPVRNGGWRFVA